MGDSNSMLESPNFQTKMGESVGSHASLQVSISFGRFDNDNSLSWDKWSTFSQNKYLEEVEKCSTPGSVAQKKAYFEAHYKKIAARKIHLLDQQNQTETDPSSSNDLNRQNHTQHVHNTDIDIQQNTNSIDAIDEPEEDVVSPPIYNKCSMVDPSGSENVNSKDFTDEPKQDQFVDEPKQDALSPLEYNSSFVDEGEDLNRKLENREFDEVTSVKEENSLTGSEYNVSASPKLDSKIEHTLERKEDTLKLQEPNISQKITLTRKERSSARPKKKIPESSTPKPTQTSTARVSKPPPTSNSVPTTSRSSIKKANVSSLPKTKNSLESKRVGPTSLHMSINMRSVNSDSASVNTLRSSLIMEKMKDKDIVKRAFKSFQNSFNQQTTSSSNDKSWESKEVVTRGAEENVSASTSCRKLNERMRKPTEKINARRDQLGKIWSSTSSGSIKEGSFSGGNLKAASLGLKTDERAEKFSRKLEEKSHTKESEKTRLSSKAKKDEKEIEMRKVRQSLNFKAKPMPDFYRSRGISTKTPSEKEEAKKKMSRLPK